MTLEKQFNLQAAEKPKTSNPIHQRRQKFINAIDKQIDKSADGSTTLITVRSSWVWQTDNGDWFISPRYGKAPLELASGLNSIKCTDVDDVVDNLVKLKTMASEGKLDKVLEAAAASIRSRFQK